MRRVVCGERGLPRVHIVQLFPEYIAHAVQVQGIELLRYEPDPALFPGDQHRQVQQLNTGGLQFVSPLRIYGQAAVCLCFDRRAVSVPGNQKLGRIVGHQGHQFQQRLDVMILAEHIARHHHAGIPRVAQCGRDSLLPVPEPCAVQVAQMQDRKALQVFRQVQHRQPGLLQPDPFGYRDVQHPQGNDQDGQQQKDRVAEAVAPVALCQLRSEDILVPLPPHDPYTSFLFLL